MLYGEDDKFNHTIKDPIIDRTNGLVGLNNLGNTCFMNSALQAIIHLDLFRRKFLKLMDENEIEDKQSMAYLLNHLILKTRLSQSSVSPDKFYDFFSKVKKGFFGGKRQHDSEEAYSYIINSIHEQLSVGIKVTFECDDREVEKYLAKRNPLTKLERNGHDVRKQLRQLEESNPRVKTIVDSYKVIKSYYSQNYSIISELFNGFMLSSLECQDCGYQSNKFDPYFILSIPINGKQDTIYEYMDEMNKTEILDKSNKWKCDHCNKYVVTKKRLSLWSVPLIFVIQLKRFSYSGSASRNNSIVDFPFELDVSSFVEPTAINSSKKYSYRLVSVINHHGVASGGHYTTYCYHHPYWYHFDDSQVSRYNGDIVTSASYILFYVRSDFI